MNEQQLLFLVQARSAFAVFLMLQTQPGLAACHALHYLQMATEMLGKAYYWRFGPRADTHRAFLPFFRDLRTNRQLQHRLGYTNNANWENLIRKSGPLAERIEGLAPALAQDGPNPEYPWPRAVPHTAPAEYEFDIWNDLQLTADGRKFLKFVKQLFDHAESYL